MKQRSKYLIIAGILAVLLFIPKKLKFGAKMFDFKKFKKASQDKLIMLQNSLAKTGLNEKQLKFALSQLLLETGEFTSRSQVAAQNNNYSGIKWINNPKQKASKGTPAPTREQRQPADRPTNFYAKFNSPDDWAADYVRILNLQRAGNTIGKPLEADTLADFNNRLYANGYYEKTPQARENYLKNLSFYYAKIS